MKCPIPFVSRFFNIKSSAVIAGLLLVSLANSASAQFPFIGSAKVGGMIRRAVGGALSIGDGRTSYGGVSHYSAPTRGGFGYSTGAIPSFGRHVRVGTPSPVPVRGFSGPSFTYGNSGSIPGLSAGFSVGIGRGGLQIRRAGQGGFSRPATGRTVFRGGGFSPGFSFWP